MNTSAPGSERNPVEALAEEFLDRRRRGERPTLEEYCRRHPELAADIRDLFPVLIRMESLGADSSGVSTGGSAASSAARLERLGDFRILREVGRGGMGVVYEAEQESLGRRVALKVLPDAALADTKQVLRFQREAKAAARLHHTNIVPVFGVGRDEGHHYYVMQFIPGMGLDAVLQELRRLRRGGGGRSPGREPSRGGVGGGAAAVAEAIVSGRFSRTEGVDAAPRPPTAATATLDRPSAAPPDPARSSVHLPGASADSLARPDPDRTFFRSVARIGQQVAEALEYANRQGVLHRDVKPSNLLLDPRGNVWVADFGLAKASDTDDLTHTGDLLGTVRYMAPERFAGRCDARSDVYALGLTLYELLALRPAFEAADRHALMQRVVSEEPARLRNLVPHLPRDLETIVAKAIAREPAGRYATAAALGEDLQRYLDDKPIKARRATAAEQAWRWARRNPAVASLAAGLLLALAVGLAGVTWQWRQAVANLRAAEAANGKAQARFALAMEAVRSFTTGASEDVILKEKALGGLRRKLLGQSRAFYERLRRSLEGEADRPSRAALAEALFDAGSLYAKVDAPEKGLQAIREAQAIWRGLLKDRPGDPVVRRCLGRAHLTLADSLHPLSRLDESRAELVRAREMLEPLTRERPGDGGARFLLAECEALDGKLMTDAWAPAADARRVLNGARVLFEELIRDSPPFTLTTTADGPTEYRRALARTLHWYSRTFYSDGFTPETIDVCDRQLAVQEELASGRFADDMDRFLLAESLLWKRFPLLRLGRIRDARPCIERALSISQGLADANPSVSFYSVSVSYAMLGLAEYFQYTGDFAGARRLAGQVISDMRRYPADRTDPIAYAVYCRYGPEVILAQDDMSFGRLVEARRHLLTAVSLAENAARAHPDYPEYAEFVGRANLYLALVEASAGRPESASGVLRRFRELIGPFRRRHPQYWGVQSNWVAGSLLDAYLSLNSGRPAEASRAAAEAVAVLEGRTYPLPAADRFYLGAAYALFFVTGRPPSAGRPAEPPGIPKNSDRAVEEVTSSVRLGYRDSVSLTLVTQLLPNRPELGLLVLDQIFPDDPFQPPPDTRGDDLSTAAVGATP